MSAACPTTEQLAAALRGRPSSADDAKLSAHLAECSACQARLEEMAGDSGWLEMRARAHAASAQPGSAALETAMRILESRSPGHEAETTSPPRLDFLQATDQPGLLARFGPYEVLAAVAIGGMGIVLKARDPALNRIVALKILPPALAANSLARARFVREARAAAAVVHEHVVPIYAVDECSGLPYLVMQFVQGRTLSERIRATGPLSVEEILRIGAQTALGLAAAHAQGLIHRDVKPSNILLENGVERVKITDFGMARAADDSALTQDGHVAGTPEYMAPEQANNGTVDQRADLFGFGCVLYEMATGVSPFRAEKPLVALRRVCEENPSLAHTLNDRIPEWLGLLIQSLMAKDPASRPQTAAEVAGELGRRLAELQNTSDPNRPGDNPPGAGGIRPRLTLPFWLAVMIIPLLLALVAIIAMRPKSPPKENTIAVTPPGETNPAVGSESQRAPLFFVSASGDQSEKGFATLAEAVEAAPAGAVIECRFHGPQVVPPVDLGGKALILRAAPGFEPVLRSSRPGGRILFTSAALVLEGLTLVAQPSPSRERGRPELARSVVISVDGAPLFAAHCRFEFEFGSSLPARPPPEFVHLRNVTTAGFYQCEFSSGAGFAMAWLAPETLSSNQVPTLDVQGCTIDGSLLSLAGRNSSTKEKLLLRGNTLAGDVLLFLVGATPDLPHQVKATNNLFAMNRMLRPYRAGASSLEQLLDWQAESNVYSVEAYAETTPAVNRHEAWLASTATDEKASLSATLGIKTRLANLTERTRATEAAAFALTPEERQRLAAQMGTMPANLGAEQNETVRANPTTNGEPARLIRTGSNWSASTSQKTPPAGERIATVPAPFLKPRTNSNRHE